MGLCRAAPRAPTSPARVLEGIALQNCDLLSAMEADAGLRLGSCASMAARRQNDL